MNNSFLYICIYTWSTGKIYTRLEEKTASNILLQAYKIKIWSIKIKNIKTRELTSKLVVTNIINLPFSISCDFSLIIDRPGKGGMYISCLGCKFVHDLVPTFLTSAVYILHSNYTKQPSLYWNTLCYFIFLCLCIRPVHSTKCPFFHFSACWTLKNLCKA